ncbi:uncharacterized protein LOC142544858 [Primulina tabacum]|uniref:uncharacterized protein LOC142544858 n=1 Tax=Primulina tabacum TaxID=48773 RepID=UPI003F59467C
MALQRGGSLIIVLVVALSIFELAVANKNWTDTAGNWNRNEGYWGYWHKNYSTQGSRKIVVGGSENWHFGYNYTEWALKNGPFYLNDTLVFKYDVPNDTTLPHSVSLLPNFWSFQKCDLRRAKKIGDVAQGDGDGFEFVLKRWQPYYFTCGERDGLHCNVGMMKFVVWPSIRPNY